MLAKDFWNNCVVKGHQKTDTEHNDWICSGKERVDNGQWMQRPETNDSVNCCKAVCQDLQSDHIPTINTEGLRYD